MSDEPLPGQAPSETWIRSAASQLRAELQRFGATFAAFATRPLRAAAGWAAGTRSFMNPLGFVASAAGVYWAIVNALAALWPVPGSAATDTIVDQLTSALGPQVHYGLLGVAMHVGLRSLGSRRPLAGSVGVAFFTGGSVGTATALLMAGAAQYFAHLRGTATLELGSGDLIPLTLLAAAVLSYGAVCFAMSRALMGLHSVPGWKALAAAGFAIVITALLFGSVLPQGSYGWHPYLDVLGGGRLAMSFGFRA